MKLALELELSRRDAAALQDMQRHGLAETGLARVALRRLLREWSLTPEHAPPGVATREELAAELRREMRG